MFFNKPLKDRYADDTEEDLREIIEKANANRSDYEEPAPGIIEVEEISSLDDLSQDEMEAMIKFMPQYEEWTENKEKAAEKVESAFDNVIIHK